MQFSIKNYIKKIILLSGFLICLLNFHSYATSFICTCCGKKISGSYELNNGKSIEVTDKDSAWTKHKREGQMKNSLTNQKCKKADIVPWTAEVEKNFNEDQEFISKLSEQDRNMLQVTRSHPMLVTYISEIFSVNSDNTNEDEDKNNIFSTYNLMKTMVSVCIKSLNKFNNGPLYILFSFIGMLFVFINSAINFFQNSYNTEGKTIEQYYRLAFQIIVSLFLVMSVSRISEFFLSFFYTILDFVWDYSKSGQLISEKIEAFSGNEAEEIAYHILVSNGITSTGGETLPNVMQGVSYALLCVQFFIPYIISILGRFGILFAVMTCCLDTLVHAFLFPIAAGDVNENLRQTKLIRYSKHIFAGALNLSVIVLILLACQAISYNFIDKIITEAKSGSEKINYYELSFIMAVLQIVKVVACNSIAKQISSHVAGE